MNEGSARRAAAPQLAQSPLSRRNSRRSARVGLMVGAITLLGTALLAAGAHAGTGGVGVPNPVATPAQDLAFSAARATWYGPGFYGDRTACGRVLRRSTVGVAHRKLPCGTIVTFSYRGRTVQAPVIDRGPYRRGYMWDLTAATAQELGLSGSGRVLYAISR
jgi:hypothetical protein